MGSFNLHQFILTSDLIEQILIWQMRLRLEQPCCCCCCCHERVCLWVNLVSDVVYFRFYLWSKHSNTQEPNSNQVQCGLFILARWLTDRLTGCLSLSNRRLKRDRDGETSEMQNETDANDNASSILKWPASQLKVGLAFGFRSSISGFQTLVIRRTFRLSNPGHPII